MYYYKLDENNNIIEKSQDVKDFKYNQDLGELYYYNVPKYYIDNGQVAERTQTELESLVSADTKESLRKEYCQREIAKLYSKDKELQLQRQSIKNPDDTEFNSYNTTVENIIAESHTLSIGELTK